MLLLVVHLMLVGFTKRLLPRTFVPSCPEYIDWDAPSERQLNDSTRLYVFAQFSRQQEKSVFESFLNPSMPLDSEQLLSHPVQAVAQRALRQSPNSSKMVSNSCQVIPATVAVVRVESPSVLTQVALMISTL
jgi:type II secretory pathway component HofQ